MKDILKAITGSWGGITLPFPACNYLNNVNIYCSKGIKARAIIISYKFAEDYKSNLDVIIPEKEMIRMYELEDFFKAPSILCVTYNDKQIWIKVVTVYHLAKKDLGPRAAPIQLTHGGNVFIPKEKFKVL